MKSQRPKVSPDKKFGIVSYHVGELESKPDSIATMSFGYFRTKSGLPPAVEKARDEAKRRDDAKKK